MLPSIQPHKMTMMRVYWTYILRQLTSTDDIDYGLSRYVDSAKSLPGEKCVSER